MALAWANQSIFYRGPKTLVYAEATFDSSYASGGEPVVPADVGLSTIDVCIPTATSGYNITYSKTTPTAGLLRLWASFTPDTSSAVAVPLESSIGRSLTTVVASCVFIGS